MTRGSPAYPGDDSESVSWVQGGPFFPIGLPFGEVILYEEIIGVLCHFIKPLGPHKEMRRVLHKAFKEDHRMTGSACPSGGYSWHPCP
jgi:hypothetical protein